MIQPSILLSLLASLAAQPALFGACTLTIEDQPGVHIERYTAQRINDVRLHGVAGFLELEIAAPNQVAPNPMMLPSNQPSTYSLLLPSRQITDISMSDRVSIITYVSAISPTQFLRREIIIPDSVVRTEQVRNLINNSLVEKVKTDNS